MVARGMTRNGTNLDPWEEVIGVLEDVVIEEQFKSVEINGRIICVDVELKITGEVGERIELLRTDQGYRVHSQNNE